jgi:hypothetical protein
VTVMGAKSSKEKRFRRHQTLRRNRCGFQTGHITQPPR